MKILVVDDDPIHLTCARDLLEGEGHDVLEQLTAFGATERVLLERPDLILVDVNMPGLSGERLVTILRTRPEAEAIPILLYSSNDEDSLRQAVARLRIEGFVCKGDPEELRRKVSRALRGRMAPGN